MHQSGHGVWTWCPAAGFQNEPRCNHRAEIFKYQPEREQVRTALSERILVSAGGDQMVRIRQNISLDTAKSVADKSVVDFGFAMGLPRSGKTKKVSQRCRNVALHDAIQTTYDDTFNLVVTNYGC